MITVVSAGASTGRDSIRYTPAGQALARAVALKETDLVSTVSWRQSTAHADPAATDDCDGWNPPAAHAVVVGAAARRFVAPGLDVSSEVDVFKSSSSVDLEWLRDVPPAKVVEKCAALGSTGATRVVSVAPLNFPWIPYARHTTAYHMIIGVRRGNLTVLVSVDLAGFAVGRCLIDLVTVGVVGEPGTDLVSEAQVARTLASRAYALN